MCKQRRCGKGEMRMKQWMKVLLCALALLAVSVLIGIIEHSV